MSGCLPPSIGTCCSHSPGTAAASGQCASLGSGRQRQAEHDQACHIHCRYYSSLWNRQKKVTRKTSKLHNCIHNKQLYIHTTSCGTTYMHTYIYTKLTIISTTEPCCYRVSTQPGYSLAMVEIVKGYSMNDWREDLKRILMQAGVKDKPTTFLYSDVQVGQGAHIHIHTYIHTYTHTVHSHYTVCTFIFIHL